MVIETKINGTISSILIDDLSINAVEESIDKTATIWLYGKSEPIITEFSFEKAKEIFIDSRKRDRYTGEMPVKTDKKKFDLVIVGEHKFTLNITSAEFEDGISSSLIINANFPVKNDMIKQFVEYVSGVESYCDYSFSKYEGTILIGKLFDAEIVRNNVEEAIRNCLQE